MAIRRLLIANRGEIAVRISRTAHRLGIGTVGVYSEADALAVHADAVDRAVALGGLTAADSYLRGSAIIDAALSTGCDAIHPGYGFLAENAEFAQSVLDAGLIWVGPTPDQIRLLGDKVAAKNAAVAAGVPTTEVNTVPVDASALVFPQLVKAAAGGGGRGMRIIRDAALLESEIESASREAAAAFGDGTVFLEPYVEHGRHIEVQIVGDHHGSVIHLGERECSIQRRNQKIIEEAPSAGISETTRRTLCKAAVDLAQSVGYHGAGTVEFLVGDDESITFLEVNTRLQVEHPVTEAVTGLDLVELQLVVAEGQPLPFTQDEVVFSGHAIEARLVAEQPSEGWMPATGVVTHFDFGDELRVDSGVAPGSVVSTDYDSMLAKVIAAAPTRSQAAAVLARGLRTAWVSGVETNLACVAAIMAEPDFLAAATPTSYLERHPAVETTQLPEGDDELTLLVAATFALQGARRREPTMPLRFAPAGWRNLATQGQRRSFLRGRVEHHLEYVMTSDDRATVRLGPWPTPDDDGVVPPDERRVAHVRVLGFAEDHITLEIDGRRTVADVEIETGVGVVHTSSRAGSATWRVIPRFVAPEASESGSGPICPLPGTVLSVHVQPGDVVADGTVLMVVEAMKMEHKISASGAAVVDQVLFAVGDRVDSGDLLVALRAEDDEGQSA